LLLRWPRRRPVAMSIAWMGARSDGGPDHRGLNNSQSIVPDRFRTPWSCGCPERDHTSERQQAICNRLELAMAIRSPLPEKLEESLFRSPGIISTAPTSNPPAGVDRWVSVSVWRLGAADTPGAIPGAGNDERAIVFGDLYRTTRISRHWCPIPRLWLPQPDKAHWRPIGPGTAASAAIGARLDSMGAVN
jgi:hypothetical protein